MTTNSQSKAPYIFGLLIVVIIILFATWHLFKGEEVPAPTARQEVVMPEPEVVSIDVTPEVEKPVEEITPVIEPSKPIEVPEKENTVETPEVPEKVLPPLDDSDAIVKQSLADIASVQLLKLVVSDDLIRRMVVYTENLAEGKLAKKHQVFNAPTEAFSVNDGAVITVNPESFKRYDMYVELFTSMSNNQLLNLKNEYKPLISEVYEEIGMSDYAFEDRLSLAIVHLLETPNVPLDTPLVSQSVAYKYALPEYEGLSDAQKQLLRLGPDNMKKVKGKLKTLLNQL